LGAIDTTGDEQMAKKKETNRVSKKDIRFQYEELKEMLLRLEEEVVFILSSEIEKSEIKIHHISSRIKEFGSLYDKSIRNDYENPLTEATDLVGVRVVCLFMSDIVNIGNVIRKSFHVEHEDNKIEGQDIASFGYMSVHFIATMKKEFIGPRYDLIKNRKFEIQLRTIAMDAWATISHYLDYKNPTDVPRDLKRDFYALSGLFYVADTHFEIFYNEGRESREKMRKIFGDKDIIPEQEINLDSLSAYSQRKYSDRLGKESTEDRLKSISVLISQLNDSGYEGIRQLDDVMETTKNVFAKYESEHPPSGGPRFNDVGVIRISMKIFDENFARISEDGEDEYIKCRKLIHSK
jgi:ppGpp synthetase/RelA/SpoT-type nucleotidyltranferase